MNRLEGTTPFIPEDEHLVRARMTTNSMFPLVPRGTQLVFQRLHHYRPGDLVVFQLEGQWICHRVVSVAGNMVETWGDWSRSPDQLHDADSLHGRCLFLVRKGVVLDLDWPVMRWGNRAAARLLPMFKRMLRRRPERHMRVDGGKS